MKEASQDPQHDIRPFAVCYTCISCHSNQYYINPVQSKQHTTFQTSTSSCRKRCYHSGTRGCKSHWWGIPWSSKTIIFVGWGWGSCRLRKLVVLTSFQAWRSNMPCLRALAWAEKWPFPNCTRCAEKNRFIASPTSDLVYTILNLLVSPPGLNWIWSNRYSVGALPSEILGCKQDRCKRSTWIILSLELYDCPQFLRMRF